MRTPVFFLLLLGSIFSTKAFSQTTVGVLSEKSFIEVTGHAEVEITPDEIYVAITIRERHEGRDEVTIEEQESEFKSALDDIGIPLDNLSLAEANANYTRVKWSKKDVVTETEYELIVKDALTISMVFEKLDELKIADAYVFKVNHSKIDSLRRAVNIQAIKTAKQKADYLLSAIGEEAGAALIVKEADDLSQSRLPGLQASEYQHGYFAYRDIDFIRKNKTDKTAIAYRKLKVKAEVYVKFEIK